MKPSRPFVTSSSISYPTIILTLEARPTYVYPSKRTKPLESHRKSKAGGVSPGSQIISKTDDVLEAVPELKNSRLVGDQCKHLPTFLSL
ncbi:unnamed protein product [Dibothriocephalus latus]|uniref:Uncharacterized protein n=1 Tax=Dibothriocephalus latus TaxID=60516 RepID=A0A3P7NF51_DIBLA|nr:unnamed protein product [Dibothriocephalus latus]